MTHHTAANSPDTEISHPYFPRDAPIQNYAPNVASLPVILVGFGALISVFVHRVVVVARRCNPELKKGYGDQLVVAWFALCGWLHIFFEGYFVLNHATLASSQSLFSQLWKEYGLSDSRYLSSDPFMLCIETLTTLIWGPLSLLTAYYITQGKKKQAQRHIVQIIVCIGHLYGVALYYGTCGYAERMRGIVFSRPEFMYYWVYYAGLNAPWAIVPAVLLWQSIKEIVRAFDKAGQDGGQKEDRKAN